MKVEYFEYSGVDGNCSLCGNEPTEYEELYICTLPNKYICSHCAIAVANLYNYARSGEYLTWPNPEIEKVKPLRKPISTSRKLAVFKRNNYRCVQCNSDEKLEVDHIIALVKGGTNDDDNLQTLCKTCNSKKGGR